MRARLAARLTDRRVLAVLLLAVLASAAVRARFAPGLARSLGRRTSCRIAVALAVPRLDAAPILLAGVVRRSGEPSCRLVVVVGRKSRGAPLALVAGDAWAGRVPSDRLPFLLVADRVGALVVSRRPEGPHFTWNGVGGHILLLPGGRGDLGPQVALAMLAYHAVAGVTVLWGLDGAAFRAGTGDYLELPLWPAERLIVAGQAHLAADLAIQGGPLPAAVLAASPAFARSAPALLAAIALAVSKATLALADGSLPAAAHWPGRLTPSLRRSLVRALARARYERLWPTDPRLDRSLFVRLDVLRRASGLEAAAPPTILAGPAEFALRRLAPPSAPA